MKQIERIWKVAFAIASIILLFLLAFQSITEYSRIETNWNYQDSIYILNHDIEQLKKIIQHERDIYNNFITTMPDSIYAK